MDRSSRTAAAVAPRRGSVRPLRDTLRRSSRDISAVTSPPQRSQWAVCASRAEQPGPRRIEEDNKGVGVVREDETVIGAPVGRDGGTLVGTLQDPTEAMVGLVEQPGAEWQDSTHEEAGSRQRCRYQPGCCHC